MTGNETGNLLRKVAHDIRMGQRVDLDKLRYHAERVMWGDGFTSDMRASVRTLATIVEDELHDDSDEGFREMTANSVETLADAIDARHDMFASIGSDGTQLVVWGLGATEEEAEEDAREQDGFMDDDGNETVELTTIPCTPGAVRLVLDGEVACEDVGGSSTLMLEGFRKKRGGGWAADRLIARSGRPTDEEEPRSAQLPRVRVTAALDAYVRARAVRDGVDVSELVRRALVRYLES